MQTKNPKIDGEELDKVLEETKSKSHFKRYSRTHGHKYNTSKSHKKSKDNRKKKKNSNRYKTCPACKETITRRTSEGKCIKCKQKIHLANGEYFLVSEPFERLIVYNWQQYTSRYTGIDIKNKESLKDVMPTPDDVSPIYLKNEAWAASKLMSICDKNFDLAMSVIEAYHQTRGRTELKELSLHYIVSHPGLKLLLEKAKKILYAKKLEKMTQSKNKKSIVKKQNGFGRPFGEDNEELR